MNRRIVTRVVDTGGAITNTLIEDRAAEIYWLSTSTQTVNTQGLLQIHDGHDPGGKLVFQIEPWATQPSHFIPPIHCEQGVFVVTDANIASYTIAWRPKKWDRPRPMKADEIKHPEA